MGDDYSFLQEKIKDEAGSPKNLRKKVIHAMILGLVFGIVACCTFIALKPWGEKLFEDEKQEVSIPEDEVIEEVEDTEADVQPEAVPLETEEQIQKKMLKKLQSAAKETRTSMVVVSGQKAMDETTTIKKKTGVILADNGSELLILCKTLWNKEPKETSVTFADGSKHAAEWKKCDYNLGIGLCAVSKESISKETWAQIEIVELGNSFRTESGDPGIVMGMSAAEELKVSYGFIAANEETAEISDGVVELLRVDVAGAVYEDGILFNQEGQMIGLVCEAQNGNHTHVISYSVSDIKKEMEVLSNGKAIPYLGIWGVELPEELKQEGLDKGIVVNEIDADSPAMKAGIQCADVIIGMGDKEIADRNGYRNVLLQYAVNNEIILTGLRKDADNNYVEMEFRVIIGEK